MQQDIKFKSDKYTYLVQQLAKLVWLINQVETFLLRLDNFKLFPIDDLIRQLFLTQT